MRGKREKKVNNSFKKGKKNGGEAAESQKTLKIMEDVTLQKYRNIFK